MSLPLPASKRAGFGSVSTTSLVPEEPSIWPTVAVGLGGALVGALAPSKALRTVGLVASGSAILLWALRPEPEPDCIPLANAFVDSFTVGSNGVDAEGREEMRAELVGTIKTGTRADLLAMAQQIESVSALTKAGGAQDSAPLTACLRQLAQARK